MNMSIRTWQSVALLACVLVGAGNLLFTAYLFREFCGVLAAQVEVYRAEPPSTPTGVRAEREWTALRKRICRE